MKSICVKSLTKVYDNRVTALKNVTLSIEEGSFIAVMGHSGSGKSTLLQMAGLLDLPSEGSVVINGEEVSSLKKNELANVRMKTIGFVFQAFHLNPQLKAYENVMLPMLINPEYKKKSEIEQHARKLIDKVGLSERAEHYPNELSGGEQQRVAIARALANDPDFILADEPTGNLDSDNEANIFELLKELAKSGKGVMVVSHNEAILDYVDKVYYMKDGTLAEERI
ncbi:MULTISPECIES: ABC transporter ATP-binding protein [unclassified Ruminococcus]|uniref:ABC transporter ATP-binding protein n=1 Tax=unclassified Ruminococcus TaxID=2608920 RepID=UPI00210C599B|nr:MULTISPECIES: ABC transporter ATP-binding protein [unclassified Ruminococcus]MCQ4022895.1 ATP-binding cassette domain-containing protein [Ruminococcus sp. zg-924]MCQ4115289.1 ATP-binding cassette domain-containing protein [Ruminococcus sp. zg-921]